MSQYECVPLTADTGNIALIQDFVIEREAEFSSDPNEVVGLEAYLKRLAWNEDLNDEVKIYLIIDTKYHCVAAYFGLRAGMVVNNEEGIPSEEEKREVLDDLNAKLVTAVVPGIEISHFAVNDNYRRIAGKQGQPIKGLAAYLYPQFIYPIVEEVASKVGVKMIYLYAAGDERLVHYYEQTFGFKASDVEEFYVPVLPDYDNGCRFMYYIRHS